MDAAAAQTYSRPDERCASDPAPPARSPRRAALSRQARFAAAWRHLPHDRLLRDFVYYDIGDVTCHAYHGSVLGWAALAKANVLASDALPICTGGRRGRLLGRLGCPSAHPLVFNGPGLTPEPRPHLSTGMTVSDLAGVLMNYEFAAAAAAPSGIGRDLPEGPDPVLFTLGARRWNRVEVLAKTGLVPRAPADGAHLTETSP